VHAHTHGATPHLDKQRQGRRHVLDGLVGPLLGPIVASSADLLRRRRRLRRLEPLDEVVPSRAEPFFEERKKQLVLKSDATRMKRSTHIYRVPRFVSVLFWRTVRETMETRTIRDTIESLQKIGNEGSGVFSRDNMPTLPFYKPVDDEV